MSEGRSELKYAMPVTHREAVLDALAAHATPDPHAFDLRSRLPELADSSLSPRGYVVHSLYLDSPGLEGYGRRLDHARIRNRVRVRTYGDRGDDARVFLECKRKLGRRVVKQRVAVVGTDGWRSADATEPWSTPELDGQPGRLARRWRDIVRAQGLEPVCTVHYLREVFVDGTARLTLDYQVRASLAGDPRRLRRRGDVPLLPEDWMVLELKFQGAEPAWMRQLVRRMKLISEPVSKFALGVARTVRGDDLQELSVLIPPTVRQARPDWPLGAPLSQLVEGARQEPLSTVAR